MPARRCASALTAFLGLVLAALLLWPGDRDSVAAARGRHALARPRLMAGPRGRERTNPALIALARAHIPTHSHWLASWGAAPEAASAVDNWSLSGFSDQTVREVVMLSSPGAALRVHLSNLDGRRPLIIADATVARAGLAGRLAGPAQPLTFDGSRALRILPGRAVISDPVVLAVHSLERIAVSLYLPVATGPLTYHSAAEQPVFLGGHDAVAAPGRGWVRATGNSWYLLTAVDTLSPPRWGGAVATLGDSITAGFRSIPGSFGAWPDDLARRLATAPGPRLAVIDEGISGNRLLQPAPCCGPSALARFGSDVLDQADVRDVIVLEGINDIGYSHSPSPLTVPHTQVSAQQVITAEQQLIDAAHSAGLRIFGATLLPFRGARYWTPAGEQVREAINTWIRSSHAFDGVIDFATVMASPSDPQRLNPQYDSGDHLHPNEAGYAAMAQAIQLTELTSPGTGANRRARGR
ncbi:MAG TPA: SGNH/GDSL hydrolase family protein [Solirubrobacteraceae bacterium]|nr:SGNH/GDSL hydrolase family protein [Solirubrobacteraceae bacterium]